MFDSDCFASCCITWGFPTLKSSFSVQPLTQRLLFEYIYYDTNAESFSVLIEQLGNRSTGIPVSLFTSRYSARNPTPPPLICMSLVLHAYSASPFD